MLILGVIASLTIPSLIQNTQKKEEVVKIKKGLSVINQAIAMDKALTGDDLSQYKLIPGNVETETPPTTISMQFCNMFKRHLSIAYKDGIGDCSFQTTDGLVFVMDNFNDDEFDTTKEINSSNYKFDIDLYTKMNLKYSEDKNSLAYAQDLHPDYIPSIATIGNMTGRYKFYCGYDRCVSSPDTAAIINSVDPTKTEE